ncbi:AMP-dependent synthetase/ligase [Solitalea canadensis]|uniref:AMP-forming long-chain acyl-CoA synthetase n=1 Tax=Solitalea canadensis (strain ATCC 29591 / DSM 3403 / JCM 21819 / LMG 8368 / NBRC 15130 / NCIMB 12057 / USAM 9D) TaxID=929556 RepID=H8KSH8_SOLCM|nr:AMP-binding protein [Solitalea canadensis]AFD08529.1 AMP-forming long-chain acyl-CoA synthetase [Solitalea canadensis DSM 3403]
MKTIIDLFEESVNRYSNNPFLWEKKEGEYVALSYMQTREQVYHLAAGLIAVGVEKNDKVAFLAEGRNAWIVGELGILYTGAVNVPLSVKLEESNDLIFRIQHSDAKYIMVSARNLPKIRAIIENLPNVKNVIVFDELDNYQSKEIHIGEINKRGEEFLAERMPEFESRFKSIKGNDYANISYTSGTTADPKGIILSHRNYTSNVEQALSLMNIPANWKTLIILPLDHCFAHVAGFYSFMASGASVATVDPGKNAMDTLKNIPVNMQEIKPNLLLSVPALAKNFKKNIESAIKQKGGITEKLFNHALKIAYAYNREGFNKGQGASIVYKPLLAFYDKILFSKVRNAFGGELSFFIGGGALLDIDLQRFFYAIGVPMFQGYGLSEATPIISSNSLKKHKLGSSGYLVKPMELKICDEQGNSLPVGQKGEIVIKGENVMMGYWKNETATADTIKNGWLHTGDLGYMDSDGFLYVLGRFKSLLIGSDGEKYSPEGIEESLVENSKFIDQVMLHNNQDAYTTALLVPNKESLKSYLRQKGLNWESEEGKKEAIKMLQAEVNEYKSQGKFAGIFPERWLPATFAILPEGFTEQNHFLNSTLKMVRGKITDHYQNRIEALYTAEGKNILNDENFRSLN